MRGLVVVAIAVALAPGCKRTARENAQPVAEKPAIQLQNGPVFPRLEATAITKLVIDRPGAAQIVLARDGGRWMIEAPIHDPADDRAMFYALRELQRMEWSKVPLPDREAAKRSDGTMLTLTITQAGATLPALELGKKRIARAGGHPGLYEVYHVSYFTFSRDLRFWRDRTVSRVARDAITGIEARARDGARIEVTRGGTTNDPTYKLVDRAGVKGRLDSGLAAQVFNRVIDLQADDIATVTPAAAGLAPAALHLIVKTKDKVTDIAIGDAAPDGRVYANVNDSSRILVLDKQTTEIIARPPSAWLH